jgi:hypothetical protein
VQGAGGEPGELSLSTATAACPNGERKIFWNIQGQPGRRGKTGGRGPAGSTGATGLQGLAGAKGDTGATGQPGPKGDPGTNGTNGTNGTSVTSAALSVGDANCPDGGSSFTAVSGTTYACNGPQGPKGDTGATGSLASAYLDAYSSTTLTVTSNSDLAFDTLAVAPVGITTNAAHTAFTVSAAGKYLINFTLPQGLTAPLSAQLTVNNSLVGLPAGFNLSRILSLSAGDVVTVRNAGTFTADVPPGVEITIVRIS